MATKRGFSGWRSISKVEESSYDGGATIASTFRNAADPMQLVVELEDGTNLVGTEAEEANEQDILAKHSEGGEDLPRLRPNEAALYLAYLLGNVNQSPANEPASGYYTHTITPHAKTFTNGAQDGSSTPLTSLTVEDTSSFPSTGTIVNEDTGNEGAYTGKTATTFTGLTGDAASDNWGDDQSLHRRQPDHDYLLPSFSVLDYPGAAVKQQWDGCILQRFEIQGGRKGFVRAAGRIMGSGTLSNPGTSRPSELSEVYLKMGDITFNIGGTWDGRSFSSGTDISSKVRSFRWAGENIIPDDLVYEAAGGQQMARAERLQRRQTLQLEVEFSGLTEQNYVLSQTQLNLEIDMVGSSGSYGVKLIFPQFRFNTLPIAGTTGVLVRTQDAAIQQHSNYGSFFAQVINQQTDYLHA